VLLAFGIHVRDGVNPAVVLLGPVLRASVKPQVILGCQWQEGLEFLVDRGQIILLEHNEVLPAIFLTDAHGGTAGEQPIQTQANGQTWECLFQSFGQTVESFEFTVLLGRMFVRVLDEFGHDGESKAIGEYQLSF